VKLFVYGLLLFVVLFQGCSHKQFQALDVEQTFIEGFSDIPQDPKIYLQNYQDSKALKNAQKNYKEKYYRIWLNSPRTSLYEAMWPHRAFTCKGKYYGINLKRVECSFFDKMYLRANFAHYMEVAKKALTTNAVNLRAFPTQKVLFRDPNRAGEGFPFDYLQNSLIAPNKPLFVSHLSDNKEWAFVFSSFGSGWVKTKDIVYINDSDAKVWMEAKQVYLLKDQKDIVDKEGFLFRLRIGMMLPLIKENKEDYSVLVTSKKDIDIPVYKMIKISKRYASKKPLLFTQKNIATVLNELKTSQYGWGGMYEQRDCSATMRDFFAPFGIWLGRNSSVQARVGKVFSVLKLDSKQKIATIEQNAVPFETMLYRKGHIVLYVGKYNDKIIVFQNMWGIKTTDGKKSGRFVIGRSVFSTLEIGKNLSYYDPTSSFIQKMRSFNIVTQTKD